MAIIFSGYASITQVRLMNQLQRGRKWGQNQNHGLPPRFQGICLRRIALLSASLCLLYLLCPTPLPLFISLVPCFVRPFLSSPFGWEKHTSAAGGPRGGDCPVHMERCTDEASGLGMSILWANDPLSLQDPKERGGCRHSQGSRWQKKRHVCSQQDENNTL